MAEKDKQPVRLVLTQADVTLFLGTINSAASALPVNSVSRKHMGDLYTKVREQQKSNG